MTVRCGLCGSYREDDGEIYCIPCKANKVREDLPTIEIPAPDFSSALAEDRRLRDSDV